MILTPRWLIHLGLAGLSIGASAQSTADLTGLRVRSLAAGCAQCHGSDGHAAPGAVLPGLAGRPPSDFISQMRAFKSGARPGSVMPQLAKGYSDAQIELLAGYFAAQTKAEP